MVAGNFPDEFMMKAGSNKDFTSNGETGTFDGRGMQHTVYTVGNVSDNDCYKRKCNDRQSAET